MNAAPDYDVIVVGAGPAGLSAALMLGRCRRSVVVFDNSKPRNAASRALHGYLTRDGIAPADFLQLARGELAQYDSVEIRSEEVTAAECRPGDGFVVTVASGGTLRARKLLLATGVVDNLPDIPGFREMYGRSVFHCPYCDGWELCDRPLAVYGRGARGSASRSSSRPGAAISCCARTVRVRSNMRTGPGSSAIT